MADSPTAGFGQAGAAGMQRKDSYDQLSAMLRMDSLPNLDNNLFSARGAETAAPEAPEPSPQKKLTELTVTPTTTTRSWENNSIHLHADCSP